MTLPNETEKSSCCTKTFLETSFKKLENNLISLGRPPKISPGSLPVFCGKFDNPPSGWYHVALVDRRHKAQARPIYMKSNKLDPAL